MPAVSGMPNSAAVSRGVEPHHGAIDFGLRPEACAPHREKDLRAGLGLHQHTQITEIAAAGPAAMRSATSACTRNTARSQAPFN